MSQEQKIALMVQAMATSQAQDEEGQMPTLAELLDFSGENKLRLVLEAAARAALDVIQDN